MSTSEISAVQLTEVGDVTGSNEERSHLLIGVDSDYEAGWLAGIQEGERRADGQITKLIEIVGGDIQVYRDLLDEADDEIAWLEHCEEHADEMIVMLFKYVGKLERKVKKLKRRNKQAFDEGFQAALALAPGEGVDTQDLEQTLVSGSQDPEFAAARAEQESLTA